MGVLEQALELAYRGLPVFPCGASKAPVISREREGGRGHLDATCDETEVRGLFAKAGKRAKLVGVPCGIKTEFDVLDIDPRHGGDRWELENAHRLPETRIHISQSGGRHYLFRHAPGVRNSASKKTLAPGVDVRGEGGYVIHPPSYGYHIASDAEVIDWPDWLLEMVLKHLSEQEPMPGPGSAVYEPISEKRLEGYVKALTANVSRAPEGGKHYALRNAALALGGIQQAAGLTDAQAVDRLLAALPGSVRDWKNAKTTALWGVVHGRDHPYTLPDNPKYTKTNGTRPPRTSTVNGHDAEPAASEDGFPLLWFDAIEASLDANDFVQGVLMEQSAAVVYGQSNSGKTFWTTDLALHVAANQTWNGRRVEGGGVIYCIMESTIGFRNRVAAWKAHHELDGHALPFAAVTAGLDLSADDGPDVDKLIATVKAARRQIVQPVRLIVIDTLSRALAGGDENAPDDMGALVKAMDKVRAETKAAVLFIHHSGKDQAKGARGHTLLTAAIDTEIEVVVDDSGELRTSTVTKQREMKKGDSFGFCLKIVELGENRHKEPVTTCVVESSGTPNVPHVRLAGQTARAIEILRDLISRTGATGFAGSPSDLLSVPEKWWRDIFYERAMPGAEEAAKRKAFRRAADHLLEFRFIGMAAKRVWLVERQEKPQHGTESE